ncbi:MAG TPA: hypothetical protein VG819_11060 [Rhizomicrobium sp.]|nr:hypothetical protein [Rhizomicrobium sp.]
MKILTKLAIGAAMLGSLAFAAPPASAGVHVGVSVGGPVAYPHHAWCRHHPRACFRRGGVVVVPRIGVFYAGRGWWDGHRYWRHRERWHGHWRYR